MQHYPRKIASKLNPRIPFRDCKKKPEIAVGVIYNADPIEVEEAPKQGEYYSPRDVKMVHEVNSRSRKRIRLHPATLIPRKKREIDLPTSSTTSKVKKMRVDLPDGSISQHCAFVRDRMCMPQEQFYCDVNDGEFAVLPSGYLAPLEEISPTDRPPDKVRSGGEW